MSLPDHIHMRINRNGAINDLKVPRPLLTLEEFFDGNDEYGSIGCNLPDSVYPWEFYEVLRRIRNWSEVADIRVEIRSWDDPKEWPFSDTVWVITSLSDKAIQECLGDRMYADEIVNHWPDYPIEKVDVPQGMRPLGFFWD